MIPGLPYDHQLEYIESTGSQYIDTGLVTSSAWSNYTVDAHFTPVSATASSSMAAFGASFWGMGGPGNGRWWDFNDPIEAGRKYHLHFEKDIRSRVRVYLDGVQKYTSTSSTWVSSYFGIKIGVFGFGDGTSKSGKWRCHGIRFYIDGVLVRDLIPVSVNGVAKMYDRVTGTFPRHYGTFVAGPVASTPLMGVHMYQKTYTVDDYKKDGLVAFCDGIANSISGKHVGYMHGWPNLVSGATMDVGYKGNPRWGSNCLITDAAPKDGTWSWLAALYIPMTIVPNLAATKTYSLEYVFSTDNTGYAFMLPNDVGLRQAIYVDSPGTYYCGYAVSNGAVTNQLISSSGIRILGAPQAGTKFIFGGTYEIGLGCRSYRASVYSSALALSDFENNLAVDRHRFKIPIGATA